MIGAIHSQLMAINQQSRRPGVGMAETEGDPSLSLA